MLNRHREWLKSFETAQVKAFEEEELRCRVPGAGTLLEHQLRKQQHVVRAPVGRVAALRGGQRALQAAAVEPEAAAEAAKTAERFGRSGTGPLRNGCSTYRPLNAASTKVSATCSASSQVACSVTK